MCHRRITANFAGYVLWSLWLITFGVLLLRRPPATHAMAAEGTLARAQG
ncbi:MAG TPA: hypothetical protein VLQ78_13530 [Ornithinibacter sp.]|nr:hypothetical protein [Ornithinibacter sp.]